MKIFRIEKWNFLLVFRLIFMMRFLKRPLNRGIDLRGKKSDWTPELVIALIQIMYCLNIPLAPVKKIFFLNKQPYYNRGFYDAANKFFGSWEKAIKAAGLNYREVRFIAGTRRYEGKSKEAVIAKWQELKKNGEPLNYTHIKENYGDEWLMAAQTYFDGGLRESVEAAGYDYAAECRNVSVRIRASKISEEKLKKIEEMFSKGD